MNSYIIYDKLIKDLNPEPFMATKALLDLLNIPYETTKSDNHDLGYELSGYDKVEFSKIYKPLFDSENTIVTIENSSHLGICKAKEELGATNEILPFYTLLNRNLELIKLKLIHPFEKFNVGVYLGANDMDLKKDDISNLLKLIGAKEIGLKNAHEPDGYSIKHFDVSISYKMAGEVLFEAFDTGCDFLIVNDIRTFDLFDGYQKQIQKSVKRPLGDHGFGIFTISQILLMALGKVKPEENFTDSHTIKPSFL